MALDSKQSKPKPTKEKSAKKKVVSTKTKTPKEKTKKAPAKKKVQEVKPPTPVYWQKVYLKMKPRRIQKYSGFIKAESNKVNMDELKGMGGFIQGMAQKFRELPDHEKDKYQESDREFKSRMDKWESLAPPEAVAKTAYSYFMKSNSSDFTSISTFSRDINAKWNALSKDKQTEWNTKHQRLYSDYEAAIFSWAKVHSAILVEPAKKLDKSIAREAKKAAKEKAAKEKAAKEAAKAKV